MLSVSLRFHFLLYRRAVTLDAPSLGSRHVRTLHPIVHLARTGRAFEVDYDLCFPMNLLEGTRGIVSNSLPIPPFRDPL